MALNIRFPSDVPMSAGGGKAAVSDVSAFYLEQS
jgi:hypothetical protein